MSKLTIKKQPFVYLFNDDSAHFVMDQHTNRIFHITQKENEVFKQWLDGNSLGKLKATYTKEVNNIVNLQRRGLFYCKSPNKLSFDKKWSTVAQKIKYERQMTIIELTHRCNLKCKYCPFTSGYIDGRIHSQKIIDEDILRLAIDDAFKCGRNLRVVNISFYGGEPLFVIDVLKQAVTYCKRKNAGLSRRNIFKKIQFSLTTNGTLIDQEIAEFLRAHDFIVTVSLDGTKKLHDLYRVYLNGKGSYADALSGLKTLIGTYGAKKMRNLNVNVVIPSFKWVAALEELDNLLPSNINVQVYEMVRPDNLIILEPKKDFARKWNSCLDIIASKENQRIRNLMEIPLKKIHDRVTFSGYRKYFYPNGCCIPGHHKVYVDIDSKYHICEKTFDAPEIGSVYSGPNMNIIRKLIRDYISKSFKNCRQCAAISNCSVCFVNAYSKGMFNENKKNDCCSSYLSSFYNNLKNYTALYNQMPAIIKKWEKTQTF